MVDKFTRGLTVMFSNFHLNRTSERTGLMQVLAVGRREKRSHQYEYEPSTSRVHIGP